MRIDHQSRRFLSYASAACSLVVAIIAMGACSGSSASSYSAPASSDDAAAMAAFVEQTTVSSGIEDDAALKAFAEQTTISSASETSDVDLQAFVAQTTSSSGIESGDEDRRRGEQMYELKVLPVLTAQCLMCHSVQKKSGGLALDDRAGMLEGGSRGPAVIVGNPGKSVLYQVVTREVDFHVSHEKEKVGDDAAAAIREWIVLGAPIKGS